ncbi:hypothetical protein [Candidatus Nitrosocosmicus arcticus]|uniref:Uncharacterized protein n=1 Tax=Candidatus Nitrosocosmicus arcticus TaxID=2035267 RepID=A0A557STP2_9ARCH|nr:hypothetical protein [Candidatus Nitrosocosmicus arcticus]TVP39973.1 hypothetical protein NARC_100035 [Candidatus Nitrosocosmicus arcticus]
MKNNKNYLNKYKIFPKNHPIDMFVESFDELAKNWSAALKEFETIYSDSKKVY